MYVPHTFEESRTEVLHEHLRRYPLATLVTMSAAGLTANLIPLQLVAPDDGTTILQGHVARANPMWQDLAGRQVLALFHGPQHYVSPSWYASKKVDGKVVPTWNYSVVEAAGTLQVIDDAVWLRAFLGRLTDEHEKSFDRPWAVSDAPEDYVAGRLRGIVGIEIAVTRLTGKWKVSQNQAPENRNGVVEGLSEIGTAEACAMAELVSDSSGN